METESGNGAQLPRLLPEEKLVKATPVEIPAAVSKESAVYELTRLAQAPDPLAIGEFGPVIASTALNADSKSEHLHRYEVLFGRDSLRVAMDLIDQYPRLARETLLSLARLQGVEVNAAREEEPGRIIHEARDPAEDPVAKELSKSYGWGWPYYGSVDATVEFVRTLSAYCNSPATEGAQFLQVTYTAKDGQQRQMADAFKAAVGWMAGRLEANSYGFLEFKRQNPGGIENQVWKDSWDSYFHANGDIANHERGIASIEIQRTAHDALIDAAQAYEHYFGQPQKAEELRWRANKLGSSIMDEMWCEEKGGYFVLGTDYGPDGGLRQLKIRTSNMGHMLHSRYLLAGQEPEAVRRREAVIKQLFSPQMLNVSGIRTLASDEYRYRPGAYHNGSVWTWDTYHIAQGLDMLGYHALASELQERIKNVVNLTRKFPEFTRGDDSAVPTLNQQVVDVWDDKYHRMNRLEQPPQEVQAWTVGAVLATERYRKVSFPLSVPDEQKQFEQAVLLDIKQAEGR